MRLKVTQIEKGLHPSQTIVSIVARDGAHFLAVDNSSLSANTIDVGNVLGINGEYRLVELPEETDDGRWRLWVKNSDLTENKRRLEAAE